MENVLSLTPTETLDFPDVTPMCSDRGILPQVMLQE
jgi:hypothetical protein